MPEEGPLAQEEAAKLVAHFYQLLEDRVAEIERRLHGQITDLRREVALLARRVSDLESIEQREIGSLEERMSDLEEEDQTRG
jgi:polyhydroxyalkanoate synthesis regulator phasin